MPARRKNALTRKQKKEIATRLMQISLLVDDYLYQQKPMSQGSATAYIKEVSTYKDKCCGDARSLQVIEKLTRCMNGIIFEQQELNGTFEEPFQDISNGLYDDGTLSPVYSNADDEDLTQAISLEVINEINLNKNVDQIETEVITEKLSIEDIEAPSKTGNVEPQDSRAEYLLNNEMEIIDLCNDEVNDFTNENNTEPEFNIQNAISNLSLRDIDENSTPLSLECSQSVLESYYPAFTCHIENSVQRDELTHVKRDVIIARQKPETENKKYNNVAKIEASNKVANKQVYKLVEHINKNKQVKPNMSTQNPKAEPKTKKRMRKSNTKLADINNTAKKTKTNAKQYTNVNKTKVNHEETQKVNKHSDFQYHNTEELTNPLTLSSKPIINKINLNTLPIYNNTVINDLSWIENIRFVREISTEEYKSFTEDEVFWDNFTLPKNWDENDFNY